MKELFMKPTSGCFCEINEYAHGCIKFIQY